jgi:hypothetical protein
MNLKGRLLGRITRIRERERRRKYEGMKRF